MDKVGSGKSYLPGFDELLKSKYIGSLWTEPEVTTAVSSRQPRHHVVAATKAGGACQDLNPLPPYPSPSSFFVPECNTQVRPSLRCVPGRLFVAGNTCSLPFLSSSLSFPSFSPFFPLTSNALCARFSSRPNFLMPSVPTKR